MQLHKLHNSNNIVLYCYFSITIHGNVVIVTCNWFPLVVLVIHQCNIHGVSMQVACMQNSLCTCMFVPEKG